VIQLQPQITIKIIRNAKYAVDMGFVVRNMTTRKRVKDASVTVVSGGQQVFKQVDTDGEFFIRSSESTNFFRHENVTITVTVKG
jgi:hypothetical protein